ncbi:MAG: Sua5/YciO/YrdC/YwlC family protein [Sulfurimonas sp.]|jgi:tRNA A37 threonylcarbamoyladenosine synthetase subunit TsaC/SUA5/YrdC
MSIILTQTDTTVGFLSQDSTSLAQIKGRENGKPFLKVFASLAELQKSLRIPLKYRSKVRHARKTTFVIKNQAVRYVNDSIHSRLIQKYGWLYSTSANESGKEYNRDFCISHSDIRIEDKHEFTPTEPSHIYHLTATRLEKLR